MKLGRAHWTEERREKHRAWSRANYQKRKNDPAFRSKFEAGRAKRRADPAKRKADVRQVVEREKTMRTTRELWPTWARLASKRRAAKFGIPHTISTEDIVVPDICPVFGVPLVFDGAKWHQNAPSLDRFIPELGYVPGNVRVISLRANRLKYNATPDELRSVIRYMEDASS